MVRRSDHCLPSDSDKFTIKLHSLPSKFLSSLLRVSLPLSFSAPPLSLSILPPLSRVHAALPSSPSVHPLLTSPRASLPRVAGTSSLQTRGSSSGEAVVYSLAITITLRTPAPPCPLRFPLSFPLSIILLRSSLLRRVVPPVSFLTASLHARGPTESLSFALRFSSLSCHVAVLLPTRLDHPVALTTAIPQLFSTLLALIAAFANGWDGGWGTLRACRYRAWFTELSSLLLASFHRPSLSVPRCLAARPRCLFLDPSHLPLDFTPSLSPPPPSPFILQMDAGIHETKLMITTSKQRRAERPTATCRTVYTFHPPTPVSLFIPPTLRLASLRPTFSFPMLLRNVSHFFLPLQTNLLFLRSVYSFSVSSYRFPRAISVVLSNGDREHFARSHSRGDEGLSLSLSRLRLAIRCRAAQGDAIRGRWPRRLPVVIIAFTTCRLSHFRDDARR